MFLLLMWIEIQPSCSIPIGMDKDGREASSIPGGVTALGGITDCGIAESVVDYHTEVVPHPIVVVQVSIHHSHIVWIS